MNYQPPPASGGGGGGGSYNGAAVAITGGTIDGTTIGSSTPEPGAFTSLSATTLTVTGDIANFAAAGITQATATPATKAVCVITSGAGASMVLTTAKPDCTIVHRAGSLGTFIYIYPASGDQIDGTSGVNQPVTIAANASCRFMRNPATSMVYCG